MASSVNRQIFVMRPDPETGKPVCVELTTNDAPAARVHVIEDTMAPLEHPCDGKLYDSKSEFARVTKAHGCVEVGCRPGDRRSANLEPRSDALYRAFDKAWYETVESKR